MAYDQSAYQDPYGLYGGYNPYGQYQGFEESPPPEPSKDWKDVPKRNRSYARKIKDLVVQKEFAHLKSENLYLIEVIVEYIKLNEELTVKQESKEKSDDEIITTLTVLNLPPSELSVVRDDRKLAAGTADPSLISLTTKSTQLTKFFQRTLSHIAKLVDESKRSTDHLEEGEEWLEDRGTDEMDNNKTTTVNEKEEEQMARETIKKPTINVMEGKSVMFLMSGVSMIQNLQTNEVKIAVNRINVTETEEGQTTETVLLGSAAIRLPQNFHEAVLRQTSTKGSYDIILEGLFEEQVLEVGDVGLTISLFSIGQGAEVTMLNDPRMYGKVNLIKAFPPESKEQVKDPSVHPRLAVTLMNTEPPRDLNKTSTEIIEKCIESKLVPSEDDENTLLLKYRPKHCRWLQIAHKQLTDRLSTFSISNINSDTSSGDTSIRVRVGSKSSSSLSLIGCAQIIDPELDMLWREHRRQCRALWEDVEVVDNNKKALYDELEELLRQDKGNGWGSEVLSEKSKTSSDEEGSSKPSTSSTRKSTLKSTSYYLIDLEQIA